MITLCIDRTPVWRIQTGRAPSRYLSASVPTDALQRSVLERLQIARRPQAPQALSRPSAGRRLYELCFVTSSGSPGRTIRSMTSSVTGSSCASTSGACGCGSATRTG